MKKEKTDKKPKKERTEAQKNLDLKVKPILDFIYELQLFPGDFRGSKNPYAVDATKEAVKSILDLYGEEKVQALLTKYKDGAGDQFRPLVGTVYEFFTFKLAKVEGWANVKKGGGLYAQQPVQSQTSREKLIAAAVRKGNESREAIRKAKEEWEKKNKKEDGSQN